MPVVPAFWASVSEEVNAKLEAQKEAGVLFRLAPSEWRSSDVPWFLEAMLRKVEVQVFLENKYLNLSIREIFIV